MFFSWFFFFFIWILERQRDFNKMSSDSAESSVELSRFSLDSDDNSTNNSSNNSSDDGSDDGSDDSSRKQKSHRDTTINETIDESIIGPSKRTVKRAIIDSDSNSDDSDSVIPETDDDGGEEEEEEDKDTNDNGNNASAHTKSKVESDEDVDQNETSQIHCFSPRTRRSITGRRSILPAANSSNDDDDDDIFSSGDEYSTSNNNETKAPTETSAYKSAESLSSMDETEEDADSAIERENSKRNRSIQMNESIAAPFRTPNPKRFSGIGKNGGGGDRSADVSDDQFRTSTPSIEFSDKSADGSSKTSDIEIHSDHSDSLKSIAHDISVVSLNSSDEENHKPILNSTTIQPRGATGAIPKIQPKLNFNRKPAALKSFVSRAFYQQKTNELTELQNELTECKNLLQRLGHTLPDKGRNLEHRCNELQRNFNKKQTELETYAIEEDHLNDVQFISESVQPKKEPNSNNNNSNRNGWRDELEAIQPIHTGKQGMATFNQQKALTLNRIEKLHKALEKCPAETEFAPQPNYLGIQLMPHQLHAIKWMHWREKTKRPKGGLLADDMGLGMYL